MNIPLNPTSVKDFAKSNCLPVNQARGSIVQNIPTPAHLHHSHKMSILKGLQFCRNCGAVQGKRIDKLAKGCLPPTTAGFSNIKNLERGKLPVGVSQWPSESQPSLLPIAEDSVDELYIQPGTDIFQRPSQDSGILNNINSSIGLIRQANKDAMRHDMVMAASSSSVQVQDCGSTISIPKRTVVEDEDDSSSD